MEMQSKQKQRKVKKNQGNGRDNPNPDALAYNGPVVDVRQRMAKDVTVIELQWSADLTASAGGVIDAVIDNDPAGGFTAGYNQVKGLYAEVRCLAMEVIFLSQ